MLAQDTGGTIKGHVRADVFWGQGDEAEKIAGLMKQRGKLYVLLPKGFRRKGISVALGLYLSAQKLIPISCLLCGGDAFILAVVSN